MARTGRPRSFDDAEVVDRAKDVFWQRGYGATSMRDLKEELGVLPGSLYGAFGDKHALFVRALERYAEGTHEAAAALAAEGPVLPRLRELLTSVLSAAADAPGRGCMLGNTAAEALPGDTEAGAIVGRALRGLEGAIERSLAHAQQTGEVRSDIDCGAHARLLVALVQGLHVVARTEPDPRRLDDAVDAALASVAAGGRD
ncbi:MAG TPA: TetR/AcrR family transcriptional regulator [Solirubrobacteraceae bacterium]|nr:TetR/AcrR family transcriptional regulator [Solirubrobacteraceae bacterium]